MPSALSGNSCVASPAAGRVRHSAASKGCASVRCSERGEIADYYKGKQVAWGFKGITVTCRYASAERTLTEAEVNPLHANVVAELEKQLQAKVR